MDTQVGSANYSQVTDFFNRINEKTKPGRRENKPATGQWVVPSVHLRYRLIVT